MTVNIPKQQIFEAISVSSSMLQASKILNVTYSSFIRYAKKHNLYCPNQGLKGGSKKFPEWKKVDINKIFSNEHEIGSHKLKLKLYDLNLKKPKCEECGIENWNQKEISFHLDHIDGNSKNNSLQNLRILCPNCHSQTPTYCRGQKTNRTLKV